jgi:putative transposase
MAHQSNNSLPQEVFELLANQEPDGIRKALEALLNATMAIEREQYLKAKSYERTTEREGYANGFKPKILKSRMGALELAVPQTRDGKFYPQSIEKGARSERALKVALAEMYLQGVSTRKVTKITEELCGFEISSATVSRVAAELDEELEKWRNRPLGCCPFVFLDARYEKVRQGGIVTDAAVLIAIGVDNEGMRKILGVSVSLSEAEVHWREFLKSLQARKLHGVLMFTSDSHSGLKAGLRSVFPSVYWQRCQFHLQQNAQFYVPKQDWKPEVASDIRHIFTAPKLSEAHRLLQMTIEKWQKTAPKLTEWMEENIPEGLTVFKFSEEGRKKLRTTNPLERINKELKRRTRVISIFPNEKSCLRLVSALLREISEEWETGKRYLPATTIIEEK